MPILSTYKEKAAGLKTDKKKMKFRVSNFLVTMNTNVRFTDASTGVEEWTTDLYRMGEHLFGDADRTGQYVTFPKGGVWDDQHIISVHAIMKVEIGHNTMGQRLHLHASVKIRHRSFIQLDIPKIQIAGNDFLSDVAYPFPIHHINVRAGRPTFEDYLDEDEAERINEEGEDVTSPQ